MGGKATRVDGVTLEVLATVGDIISKEAYHQSEKIRERQDMQNYKRSIFSSSSSPTRSANQKREEKRNSTMCSVVPRYEYDPDGWMVSNVDPWIFCPDQSTQISKKSSKLSSETVKLNIQKIGPIENKYPGSSRSPMLCPHGSNCHTGVGHDPQPTRTSSCSWQGAIAIPRNDREQDAMPLSSPIACVRHCHHYPRTSTSTTSTNSGHRVKSNKKFANLANEGGEFDVKKGESRRRKSDKKCQNVDSFFSSSSSSASSSLLNKLSMIDGDAALSSSSSSRCGLLPATLWGSGVGLYGSEREEQDGYKPNKQ
ncbi:hypothetical protein Fcan01_21219 [Folsomia candida]|uniref:Uncharacterized protein n=1 Tax=Folsomia candida TaxID=158441 RepID=A0A226DER6_FOLCA|nr:hypothetical protein Fcan01_21219 [Folsomia candida]